VKNKVCIIRNQNASYSLLPPYHPDLQYPELVIKENFDPSNKIFSMVRESFFKLGYDSPNYNTDKWNPLGWLINPGETVFIKPNMISHKHLLNDDWDYVITHGSVIRAVVDYVYIALKGEGKIIIGDGPQTDSDYDKIIERMSLRQIQELYKKYGFCIELIDLRKERWMEKEGVFIDTLKLAGDPYGSLSVDLGKDSMFHELDNMGKKYYGAFYDTDETNLHHSNGKHEYAVCRSPVAADVFINIPKLKTHNKCGLTINLKSLVGINANKNWLPHYIFGSPETGGDQFNKETFKGSLEIFMVTLIKKVLLKKIPIVQLLAQKGKKIAYKIFGNSEEVIRSGNWHGNDTVWRMCLDLNRIVLYADKNGILDPENMKRYFSVVDGIASMEGNGAVAGSSKETGLIIAGEDPISVDCVCALIMGFDYRKIQLLARAFDISRYPLFSHKYDEIAVISNNYEWNGSITSINKDTLLYFKPPFGWIGHMEI